MLGMSPCLSGQAGGQRLLSAFHAADTCPSHIRELCGEKTLP